MKIFDCFMYFDEETVLELRLNILNKYVDYYHDELLKNSNSIRAKDYLKKRGLTKEEVQKFKIGFETNDLNFQQNIFNEFNENEIKDTGLFYFDEK